MFKQVTSFKSLLKAYKNAAKAKKDRRYVQEYDYNLEYNLYELQRKLRSETYNWGNYRSFYVHDPKKRLISAAPFEDRIVHHAIHAVIEPLFEKKFIPRSYACRKNKGTHKGLLYTFEAVQKNSYYLKCDIANYFDSINGQILYRLLQKEIKDKKLLRLLKRLIASGSVATRESQQKLPFHREELTEFDRGVPIGNLTSQLFANIYLHELDIFVKQRLGVKDYIRYMDDFVLFADSKKRLWSILENLEEFLSAKLKLRLHPRKVEVTPIYAGTDFLGYKIYPEKILLRRRNLVNFHHRRKKHAPKLLAGKEWNHIEHSIASFLGMANYLYPKQLRDYWFSEVFSHPFNILEISTRLPDRILYPLVERKEKP